MNKQEFIASLKLRLVGLPQNEIDARAEFYGEMIDDRIEEGASEEEAVLAVGSLDDVVREILSQIPIGSLVKEKIKPKRGLRGWEILLLALGAPLWLSLLLGGFSVVLGIFACAVSVLVSLWATGASLAACGVGGALAGIILFFFRNGVAGAGLFGAALVCAGLSIFMFYASNVATKGTFSLVKKCIVGVKCLILKGGRDDA